MITALAYCPADQAQAAKLITWMQELGPYPNHEMLLFRERKAQPIPDAGKGWGKLTEQVFDDPFRRWPISTTNAFSAVSRYVEHTDKTQPFLWLEPDCVPIKRSWLDALEKEYRNTKKVFVGAMVPGIGGTPDHLSGVAIWPGEMTKYAGQALMLDEDQPFDITACELIYRQAHFTDLIQHSWDRPAKNLSGEERMKQITSECVLFHGDKSGALIDFLRSSAATNVQPIGNSGPPLAKIPAQGERKGDLVFKNGAWRNDPELILASMSPELTRDLVSAGLARPVSSLDKHAETQGFKQKNLDGAEQGQPEKIEANSSPGNTVPLAPSKTLQFGSDELQREIEAAIECPDYLSPPWSNKKASEKEVRLLCESLALFCKAPIYKKRVRDALREARVIK